MGVRKLRATKTLPDLDDGSRWNLQADEAEKAAKTLAELPLFKGVNAKYLQEIVKLGLGKCELFSEYAEVPLEDGGPMYIVVSGALQICVGTGELIELGPGGVVNAAGMLGLLSKGDQYKPAQPRERDRLQSDGRVQVLDSRMTRPGEAEAGTHESFIKREKAHTMQCLCPLAQAQSGPGDSTQKLPGWLRLSISAAPPPQVTSDGEAEVHITRLLAIQQEHMSEVLTRDDSELILATAANIDALEAQAVTAEAAAAQAKAEGSGRGHGTAADKVYQSESALAANAREQAAKQKATLLVLNERNEQRLICCANRDLLVQKWLLILRSFVFPGLPPEIAWALAEVAQHQHLPIGGKVATEGETGDGADSIIIIDEGECEVITTIHVDGAVKCSCGTVGSGAIIGDTCYLGISVPRAATVTASTPTTITTIGQPALLSVFRRFPGMTGCIKGRLRETAKILRTGLPGRGDVLRLLAVFSPYGDDFIKQVAKVTERQIFFCNHVIKKEGNTEGTMSIVEFGICTVETAKAGIVNTAKVGFCFGERVFMGEANCANATVRAATPFVFLLSLAPNQFQGVLKDFPKERAKFKTEKSKGVSRGGDVSKIKVFEDVSASFIQMVAGGVEKRAFMPGQTICVEGEADVGSCYIIEGGRAQVEKEFEVVSDLAPGAVFGELAMMGHVRRRVATVRATTLVFVLEISRQSFLAAVDQHQQERQYFETLLATEHASAAAAGIEWPIFKGGNKTFDKLNYLVNLSAERRIAPAGGWVSRKGEPLERDGAILVFQGTLQVVNGDTVEEFSEGDCLNEQIFLDLPSKAGEFIAKTPCEVQIINKDAYKCILDGLVDAEPSTDVYTWVHGKIVDEMARKAEEWLGFKRDSVAILKFSALFRMVPEAFAEIVRKQAEAVYYKPGQAIMEEGQVGNHMAVLIWGTAHIDFERDYHELVVNTNSTDYPDALEFPIGSVFGEALALGAANHSGKCSATIRAHTDCLVYTVSRRRLRDALGSDAETKEIFAADMARGTQSLQEMLLRHPLLSKAGPEFIAMACKQADDAFFAPGEEIINRHASQELGQNHIYVLLTGQADIENEFDIIEDSLCEGDMCGEGAGLGVDVSTRTVRAWKGGLTHCAVLRGHAIRAAAGAFAFKYQTLVNALKDREFAAAEKLQKRRNWMEKAFVPAVSEGIAFSGFPRELLVEMSRSLVSARYRPGEIISRMGETADSMLVMAEGEAVVTSKQVVVGHFNKGATFGLINLLGLFTQRMATVTATIKSLVLTVPSGLMNAVLSKPSAINARLSFEQLKQQRLKQVEHGLPLCGVVDDKDISIEEVGVRTVALHAERVHLTPGRWWTPRPDTGACGSHLLFFLKGRAHLGVGQDGVFAMNVTPGSIIAEGVVHKFRGWISAVTTCEAYRVRMCDFMMGVHLDPAASIWYSAFMLKVEDQTANMRVKLQGAEGTERAKGCQLFKSLTKTQLSISHRRKMDHFANCSLPTLGLADNQPLTKSSSAFLQSTSALPSLSGSSRMKQSKSTGDISPKKPNRNVASLPQL
jgi:CRP-like cAMP-binding protein